MISGQNTNEEAGADVDEMGLFGYPVKEMVTVDGSHVVGTIHLWENGKTTILWHAPYNAATMVPGGVVEREVTHVSSTVRRSIRLD